MVIVQVEILKTIKNILKENKYMINDKQNKVQQLVSDIDSMMQAKNEIQEVIEATEDELRNELYAETANSQEEIPE